MASEEYKEKFSQSGVMKLTSILEDHLKVIHSKKQQIDELINADETNAMALGDARKTAVQNEEELLNSILEDFDELSSFLKNVVLIENLFNQMYDTHKQEQHNARLQYAPNIAQYESVDKKSIQNKGVKSFVQLIFFAQTHHAAFDKWLKDEVLAECNKQNIKMMKFSGAATKKIPRAFYKAFYVYPSDGHLFMTDMLRCSIVFDNFVDLYKTFTVIETLANAPGSKTGKILRVKDRYEPDRVKFGYRDLMLNIKCPGSPLVCEIQLHYKGFYQYKKVSHKMYKRARLFDHGDGKNAAYEYASTVTRKKIGDKVYQPSQDELDTQGVDNLGQTQGTVSPQFMIQPTPTMMMVNGQMVQVQSVPSQQNVLAVQNTTSQQNVIPVQQSSPRAAGGVQQQMQTQVQQTSPNASQHGYYKDDNPKSIWCWVIVGIILTPIVCIVGWCMISRSGQAVGPNSKSAYNALRILSVVGTIVLIALIIIIAATSASASYSSYSSSYGF